MKQIKKRSFCLIFTQIKFGAIRSQFEHHGFEKGVTKRGLTNFVKSYD